MIPANPPAEEEGWRPAPNTLTKVERAEGWQLLFDGKTFNGWQGSTTCYSVADGKLVPDFGTRTYGKQTFGDLLSIGEYDDFILRLDFKLDPGGNNGVLIRAPRRGHMPYDGMEVEVLDELFPRFAEGIASRPSLRTGSTSRSR